MTKPVKHIAIVDAGKNTAFIDAVLVIIQDRYQFKMVHPRKADYIFHSCMGKEVVKYDGIRIFVTGECVTPDKNKILVKVITKSSHLNAGKPSSPKNGAFPGQIPEWGSCRFVFGNEQNYDWLVVYDDFVGKIDLNCKRELALVLRKIVYPLSAKTLLRSNCHCF